jgi:UDP:flavonoid glycosyltransferase YjiC (YdhE family)
MASILYAWEFGAGLGHVGPFMPLAQALREQGHAVHWAVSQPGAVGAFLHRHGFGCLPAPHAPEARQPGPPVSYADILLRFGYASPDTVFGLVQAWRGLMQATGAQLVVADHAPTAVLAARTLGLPVLLFSFGFSTPPAQYPLPNMRPWSPVPEEGLRRSDDTVRHTLNSVLAAYGQAPLQATADLFQVAEQAIVTFPELDHYAERGPFAYWGALPFLAGGAVVDWSTLPSPRFFVYMRQQVPQHREVLQAMQQAGYAAVVYFPDAPVELEQVLAGSPVRLWRQPVDLQQAMQGCDAVVCYASSQTTAAALMAGKPLLLMPSHLEQFMLAKRVEALGAGVVVNPEHPPADWSVLFTNFLDQPRHQACAQAFAQKYQHFDQTRVLANLVRRIEGLLN